MRLHLLARAGPLAAAVLTMLATGCGGAPVGLVDGARLVVEVTPGPPLPTAGPRPQPWPVQLVVRHEGGAAVQLAGCPQPPAVHIERLASGRWQDVGSIGAICLAVYGTQTVTLTRGDSVSVHFTVPHSGQYRFTVPVGARTEAPDGVIRSREVTLQ